MEYGLSRGLFERKLEEAEVDTLAVVAMAGVAAEGLRFEEVQGQNADLFDLQRTLNRSAAPLSADAQKNLTRWAVWQAAAILKAHRGAHAALMEAMARGASVEECLRAIEGAVETAA